VITVLHGSILKTSVQVIKNNKNRLAAKLTEHHIHPNNFEKMRVKYAVHVISAPVACALETCIHLNALPEPASATVEFTSRFDTFFYIFNSSSVSSNKLYNKAFKGKE
jgi:dihydroorotase